MSAPQDTPASQPYGPSSVVSPPKPPRVTEGPEIGLPPGVTLAELGPRVAAYFIDASVPIVLGVIWLVVGAARGQGAPTTLVVIFVVLDLGWFVVVWRGYATKAAGPGAQVLKLQLVRMSDGRPIGWVRYLVRALIFGLAALVFPVLIVLLIILARHPRRQGTYDVAVGSVLIKARPLAPRPAKSDAPSSGAAEVRYGPVTPGFGPSSQLSGSQPSGSEPSGSEPSGSEPSASSAEWRLRLDGREVTVQRLLLIGRNPQRGPGEDDAEIVTIKDEARTVSKTHVGIGVDERGLYVVDRGSTNGTAVTSPDGGYRLLQPGEPARIEAGWVVAFGRHELTVSRAG
ncbi:MAG: RDD family protein [Propionibacteriaceae bacterium]